MKLELLPSGSLAQVEEWVEELDPLDLGPELFKGKNSSCGAKQGLK
jgi:hypothetical protein